MAESRTPKPWVAACLSLLLVPGLGQVYNGALRSGAVSGSVHVLLGLFGAFIGAASFPRLVVVSVTSVLWRLCVAAHAAAQAKRLGTVPSRWFNRWHFYLLIVIALASGLAFARPHYRFKAYRIPSAGMDPTLLVGDFLFSDTWWPRRRTPQPGDVIVFRSPMNDRDFIKRCVAVAGDTVEIRSKQLYINGVPQTEPHVVHGDPHVLPLSQGRRDFMAPLVVPEGHIFVLGDNRDNSHDSRFWGSLPLDRVRAKALFVYFSVEVGSDSKLSHVRWERLGHAIQ